MKIISPTLSSLILTIGLATGIAAAAEPAVGIARVESGPVASSYPAEAFIEALDASTVAAQVQGRVIDVRVDAGSHVKRGDVLMRIDASEADQAVAAADAQVAQAQANLSNARAAYDRSRSLVARNFISRSALDQSEAAWRAAEAQLRAAVAGRAQATTSRGFATVTAPISGVVSERLIEQGEMAQPGRALVAIYTPGSMRAVADLPQYKLDELRRAPLQARVEFPAEGRWVDASSVTLLPAADPRTHTVRARVQLPANVPGIVPGMFARVHFLSGQVPRLTVPVAAVLRRGEVTAVYVSDGKGGFRMRQVRLGETIGEGRVEVLAGLAGSEDVALDPVRAGIAVRSAAGN
ncbi:efflux RND transporter periplasmic adaptor subunit [Cognatazoarcus halotolerans]|uniref:efflux RND transporter periplasmic adaptor subunit n=1 Tax=Cognatazoarcus halotolerans TaxID=2686016 RepID=UPI001358E152|nr:efflux RND transporter periplasmic adaptor subunit [Cognatazoarcus halotolerans]MCB1899038.1 efflux RND transporter periplasmic adaptor subunit [Rhodocyclaceae bacterium]MCP5308056.1 efflux RND transporter periplasmic adaptor subunit [Zoogloeaceae bacterium]